MTRCTVGTKSRERAAKGTAADTSHHRGSKIAKLLKF